MLVRAATVVQDLFLSFIACFILLVIAPLGLLAAQSFSDSIVRLNSVYFSFVCHSDLESQVKPVVLFSHGNPVVLPLIRDKLLQVCHSSTVPR